MPDKQTVSARLPEDQVETIEEYAEMHGLSKSDAFRKLVWAGMEHHESESSGLNANGVGVTLAIVLSMGLAFSALVTVGLLLVNVVSSAVPLLLASLAVGFAIKSAVLYGYPALGEAIYGFALRDQTGSEKGVR